MRYKAFLAVVLAALVFLAPTTPTAADPTVTSGFPPTPTGVGGATGTVSPNDAWHVVWSGADLTGIDALSGAVLPATADNAASLDHIVFADLASSDALAFDPSELAEQARRESEARRRSEEEQRRAEARSLASAGQTEVGPDGCPTAAPANTLREGAATIGVAELCARSVAQAPTPEAAGAIKVMLAQLGTPYSQPLRMTEGHSDCSSYISRAYEAAGAPMVSRGGGGWAPTTWVMLDAPWTTRIPYSEARPGDLLFPSDGHVALLLSDGYMVHTNRTGDVSHVKRAYGSPWATLRVDPSRL